MRESEPLIFPAGVHLATVLEGISFCPEAAACVVAARQLLRDGRLQPD